MPDIQIDNQLITYQIRRSQRARYIRLKITPHNGLEIVIPADIDVDIEKVMQEQENWIRNHLHRLQTFQEPQQLYYLGEPHALEISTAGQRTTVTRLGLTIQVRLRADENDDAMGALEKWYRREARHYIIPRVEEWATLCGLRYGRVAIRGQRTRWGSCSAQHNLNFNWRLMMAPREVIDYVIVHELCHLAEMNHSPRFWRLVEKYYPTYKKWRKWLRENGFRLLTYEIRM